MTVQVVGFLRHRAFPIAFPAALAGTVKVWLNGHEADSVTAGTFATRLLNRPGQVTASFSFRRYRPQNDVVAPSKEPSSLAPQTCCAHTGPGGRCGYPRFTGPATARS